MSLLSPQNAKQGSDRAEIEWQFRATDLHAVAEWIGSRPEADSPRIGETATKKLQDSYYDTADWRIHRAGYALRIRRTDTEAEATLKELARSEGNLARRREITEPLEYGEREMLMRSDGPVSRRVRFLCGTQPLRELFLISTERQIFRLLANGKESGTLGLDATEIHRGKGHPVHQEQRVEIEMADRAPTEDLEAFMRELQAACPVSPVSQSKYELGMEVGGLRPAGLPELGSQRIDASMSIGEVALAVLRRHFLRFLENEPGTRLGEDPECLHDMRVASRRLRAAIRLFGDYLPRRALRIQSGLQRVGRALGEVRDLDVQLDDLRRWSPPVPLGKQGALESLLWLLEARRETARARMLKKLDDCRTESLKHAMVEMLRPSARRTTRAGREPAVAIAPRLIRSRAKKVRKTGKRITPESPSTDYHALRIRCKRMRYAMEFLKDLYGEPIRELIVRTVDLQDLLGLHQDAYVAIDLMKSLSASKGNRLSRETVFALGQIASERADSARRLRKRFPKTFDRLVGDRKIWQRCDRAMSDASIAYVRSLDRKPTGPDDERAQSEKR